MKKSTGLGGRLIACIQAKGYADPAAKFGIKVTEFALDHRYPPGHVYKWVGDVVVPDYETMRRLAKDLNTTAGWLHYGDTPPTKTRKRKRLEPHAIRGGSDGPESPGVVQVPEMVSLIGRWLGRLVGPLARPMLPLGCPA